MIYRKVIKNHASLTKNLGHTAIDTEFQTILLTHLACPIQCTSWRCTLSSRLSLAARARARPLPRSSRPRAVSDRHVVPSYEFKCPSLLYGSFALSSRSSRRDATRSVRESGNWLRGFTGAIPPPFFFPYPPRCSFLPHVDFSWAVWLPAYIHAEARQTLGDQLCAGCHRIVLHLEGLP